MRRLLLVLAIGTSLGTAIPSDRAPDDAEAIPGLARARLLGAGGEPVVLGTVRGRMGLVLVFTGIDCPIGNLYMPRLEELSRRYRSRGIAIAGINSNHHETVADVAAHARTYGVTFPVLKDPENRFADMLGVDRTCEVIVLDARLRVRYRGPIDDQYSLSAHRDAATTPFLAQAVEALLAGRDVPPAAAPVVGCPIDRAAPRKVRPMLARPSAMPSRSESAAAGAVGAPTFARDVAPILQAKCQACHRPGQVGRFSLLTYAQAKRWASSIAEVVDDGRMPPWHADPRYGRFENDRSLDARQKATLLAWVRQGAPAGNLATAPPPRTFPEGWTIGTPNVVFEMPEEYLVPAQGTVPYQHFRVRTHFAEDRWVQALEARPGNRAVVHHIVVFVDDHKQDPRDPQKYRKSHLVSFAPGDLPAVYPPGTAKLLPAGAELIFEVHYTPIGVPKSDRSSVGLIFAREPVTRRAYTTTIAHRDLVIPPGDPNFEVRSTLTFEHPVHLLGFMPHMHLRGKDFQYTAAFPDGHSEVLLSVPAFDFAWQSIYRLASPRAVPAGTRIDCLAHFDNSSANPANPDPTRTVTWGEQTWDEMMIGFLDFAEDLPGGQRVARGRR